MNLESLHRRFHTQKSWFSALGQATSQGVVCAKRNRFVAHRLIPAA